MGFRIAAELTLLLHIGFVVFVLCGGLLCLRWPRWAWLHLPALAWGVLVEWLGWICPLTPLENRFRALATEEGYRGGFIEHYLLPLVYPEQLSRPTQFVLGCVALVVNILIYALVLRRLRNRAG